MIEVVYNKQKEEAVGNESIFTIPKNVRQIGDGGDSCRIYIEDYAYSFLTQETEAEGGRLFILLGANHFRDNQSYLFITSALEVVAPDVSCEHIPLTEEAWARIYDLMHRFFPMQDVMGWSVSLPIHYSKCMDMLYRTHKSHFSGGSRILFYHDSQEGEDHVFRYQGKGLERQSGYYVYYDRNEAMQEYLIAIHQNSTTEENGNKDTAVVNFRKIIEKKEKEKSSTKVNPALYVASACLALAVAGVGAVYVRNNLKLDHLRQQVVDTAVGIEVTDISPTIRAQITPTVAATKAPEPTQDVSQTIQTLPQDAGDTDRIASYTIREGDTLNAISYKFYGTILRVDDICSLNNIGPGDTIYPGQLLLLP